MRVLKNIFLKLLINSSLFFLLSISFLTAQTKYEWKTATANGYTYKYVSNDPTQTRVYTLKNGLTVMLSPNHKEPRIVYRMAVRAGSNNDPKDHTGLAHYLEHLLFKGTDKYGTINWVKEKPYIDTIYALYEKYNSTADADMRKEIYKEIDRVSGAASHYAISGEYSKLMADIGSQKTNAHTAMEETVFEEDFPSNETDKFLLVQAERFRNPVFRLFHTELEAVYEEKNRALDNDARKVSEAMNAAVFPTHNYGQQTTIGTIEHLKNPSLVAIKNFYQQYYVPNNMGLVLSGDFDADEMIKKIDHYFSYMKPNPVTPYNPALEPALTKAIEINVYCNSGGPLRIAFRTAGSETKDAMVLKLISKILSNTKAGMFDIDLNRNLKVQTSSAGLTQFKDYGEFIISASGRQGQTAQQVRDTLLAEMTELKKGNFDDTLIRSVIANNKLAFYTSIENSTARAMGLTTAFIRNRCENWDKEINELDEMSKLTKQEILEVANRYFGDGYVIIHQRKGEDKNAVKVEKPAITPVETNADMQSEFLKQIFAMPVNPITPQWVDFTKDFQKSRTGIAEILYAKNNEDGRFRMHYRFEMGSRNNKLLPVAAEYLQYLGTDKYSNEQISKTFYDLACSFNLNATAESCAVNLSGLQENFGKAIILLEEVIANCKPNEAALAALKGNYLKTRPAAKNNKSNIMLGLMNYAKYGADNPFNNVLSNQEIQQIQSQDLIDLLHSLMNYKHDIIYYGSLAQDKFTATIAALHQLPAKFTDYPKPKSYKPTTQNKNLVLFAEFDMLQTDINWSINGSEYDVTKEPIIRVFNNYFGAGGTSLVFQIIRDSKALAYATGAVFQVPPRKENPFSFAASVGCQADKMNDAINSMNQLLTTMPVNEKAFEQAKAKRKTDIETERISGVDLIFTYLNAKAKGLDYDERKIEYTAIDHLTIKDALEFHQKNISNKPFTLCVVGAQGKINVDDLKKIGDVKILKPAELFGY